MSNERSEVSDLLVAVASEHGTLLKADETALRELHVVRKMLGAGQDAVRQGDRPKTAVFVLKGMLARYHTLRSGDRQYLALHVQGDMPDVQSLFLEVMDHSVCALGAAEIALFEHDKLQKIFLKRPGLAFAFWRMTLVDAAIFRQHITDNSARSHSARLAHLCCEQLIRARQRGLAEDASCDLPLNQIQLGQLLGMSHISVNRAIQKLRKARLVELRRGKLQVHDWTALCRAAEFDDAYLHLVKKSEIATKGFRGRA